LGREHKDASEFATMLNATGKMKMEHLGIALCLNMPEASEEIKDVLVKYRREIGKALAWLRANRKIVRSTESAHYVNAGDRISEDIISNVVSIVNRSDFFEDDKPVFAMVNTEDSKIKISARASDKLVNEGLNLKELVAEVVEPLGGEGGGHSGAAGATIPMGSEQTFVDAIERYLKDKNQEKEAEKAPKINKKEAKKDIKTENKEKDYGGEKDPGNKGPKEDSGKVSKKVEGKGLVRYLSS
jgi:RecJ-like exonuclease